MADDARDLPEPPPTPADEAAVEADEQEARRSLFFPVLALVLIALLGFLVMRGCGDRPTGPDASRPAAADSAR